MTENKKLDITEHSREIRQRGVTFTCAECERTVTEMRYPGPTPKYCLECVETVRRRQARERKRRQRENKK